MYFDGTSLVQSTLDEVLYNLQAGYDVYFVGQTSGTDTYNYKLPLKMYTRNIL